MTSQGSSPAIPNRPAFKASEVCALAKVQPYVLRSWESEFPDLGVSRTPGGPRVYRRADVERVLRIRQLVFDEGLTLAGVRRRLDSAAPTPVVLERPGEDERELLREVVGSDLKLRLSYIRDGLRSLLDLVSRDPGAPVTDFRLEAPAVAGGAPLAKRVAKRVARP
jgi:DNA-binding transcriptional MerR regulator